ncbi:hypothetical protein GBF38_003121 [Nibea albiflora]|uniref:Uncharacterized protein n=1 Tax=Nibea albiflora TaxID=240163 RepID=A0ACB7FJ89_NIBAL|nr:hypothetical protein GBF38_003121 [Nibea albiflora]
MQRFTAAEKILTNQNSAGKTGFSSMLQVQWLSVMNYLQNDISILILILSTIISDLQVKVIPTTEGQTVSLMCSTSCPLTENPAAYIWYKNREFLYQDWSPWYQQLVSSEEAVTYSCAIKGYEDLRAPEVSVELRLQKTHRERYVQLTCGTSCPLIDAHTAYKWYNVGNLDTYNKSQRLFTSFSDEGHSCAVNNHEDLHSAQVCPDDKNCWSVNYVSRRICALRGSSVNISSEYLHPEKQQPTSKCWYKIKRSVEEDAEELIKAAGRVEYHDNMKNHHILTINNLNKNDSAEYTFRLQQQNGEWKQSDFSGVTLVVTGLSVKFTPSAVVTEGQRVTLTCSTSCPLTDNTNYIWYLNSRPLTLPENQHKQLVLDPLNPGPLYEDISAQPADQEELHYSSVNICKTQSNPIYSSVHSQRKDVTYAVVNFRSNTTPE